MMSALQADDQVVQREEGESAVVVQLAVDQRMPRDEEYDPLCVICGRYGAYICDATDEDVCSMECRDQCIERHEHVRAAAHAQAIQRAQAAKMLRKRLAIRVYYDDGNDNGNKERADRAKGYNNAHHEREIPFPITDFAECALPPALYASMRAKMYATPTPVQMQVIPCALQRKHLLVIAPTGTGKTAAYLIPTLAQIINAQSVEGHAHTPFVLILAPIRELAIQIEDVTKTLVHGIPMMKTALLVGGFPIPPQLHRLSIGVQVIIATPGRLIDIVTNHHVDTRINRSSGPQHQQESFLESVICCVVDEVDMMLDIGFHAQMIQIMAWLPPISKLQMLFLSATMSARIKSLVKQVLTRGSANESSQVSGFVHIEIGTNNRYSIENGSDTLTVNPNILQTVVWVEDKSKKKELFKFLQTKQQETTLVFVRSKIGANLLANAVEKQTRIPSASIHSDKSQQERLKALESFVNEDIRVLVSTNVLSRGMDLLQVQNVVVFDFPSKVADYIHLIGRTGRGSEGSGTALVMVNAEDKSVFAEFVGVLRSVKVVVPREIYQSLHKDAQKTAFRSSTAVIDASKRAFQVRSQVSDELGKPVAEWREWSEQTKKKMRPAH
uniref:RNA helicase n=1 Tax=Globisporangium ultimum (strain ATCC 200006 / CBS 805.95 / DAOM BR144) TaxID=431595 RepID=K3WU31_GLOUD